MGCVFSSPPLEEVPGSAPKKRRSVSGEKRRLQKPKAWKHPEPLTRAQLVRMREEFWDTAPHYGGRKVLYHGYKKKYMMACLPCGLPVVRCATEIWDALKLATESDTQMAQAIVDSTGIILESNSLAVCYDERGAKYELPNYVLSEPQNLKDR